jgi:hypothetical protein
MGTSTLSASVLADPPPDTRDFYLQSLDALDAARVPYVVGGGYALAWYTGIERHTKDLDVFVRPGDRDRALDALAAAGYRTEVWWPHFLAKALHGEAFIDVIYNSGNGLCPVDEDWFTHAVRGEVLGRSTPLCPPEEMIWGKAFVMERDRFDGPDIAHLVLACADRLDWARLINRFASHERILLAHLLLFGYVYPSERALVPPQVIDALESKVRQEPAVPERVCQGTFLSKTQYLPDVRQWGYRDPRLQPAGPLSAEDVAKFEA